MGEWGVYPHVFITLVIDGSECSASCSGHFTTRERICGTNWMGGWVGPRAGQDMETKDSCPADS